MLQEAKDLQNSAVTKLVNILGGDKKELIFKAPTGSGKTYMMADFMNRILQSQKDVIFIVSTLSKGNLAEQNFESFKALNENNTFPKINPYLINSDSTGEGSLFIPTDYNVYVLPRDLYKQKSKLKEEGIFLNFLKTLIFPINSELKQKKIILIKDECHIETKNLNELAQYFQTIINFSATPDKKKKQYPDVEITNIEAENVSLIKKVELGEEEATLTEALDVFEDVRKKYINKLNVNPCFIIQISNKDKADEELNNIIFPALSKHQDLKWVYITHNDDKTCKSNDSGFQKLPVSKWKDYMKEKESSISVIIFKMMISEGYDIPRACMLYQIRDSESKQLDEQVMGRVRRNPRLLDYESLSDEAQNLAMTAWIWGIIPKDEHAAKEVNLVRNFEIEKSIRIKPTKLQNINAVKSFDVDSFIQSLGEKKINPPSIFDSYQKLVKQDNEIQKLCYEYSDSYSKWNLFTENLSNIKTTFEAFLCDYEKSMVTCNEVSFPYESCFVENDKSLTLDDWVWCRKDDSNDFSFDSEAEWKWAQILKDIRSESIGKTHFLNFNEESNKFLWGKNFPFNSEIKFEYYLNGIHSSYPDFIMKDKRGIIHIFEVKSVNKSSTVTIDEDEYEEKVRALKLCYKECSKKTGHVFYLPILDGKIWKIFRFINGDKDCITVDEFKKLLNTDSAYNNSSYNGSLEVAERK